MSLIYPAGDEQVTPNIGLATWGMDEVLAENMILIDAAIGGPTGSIKINGSVVPATNFINSASVTFSVVGSNVSATATSAGSAAWASLTGDLTEAQVIPWDGPTPGTPDTGISRLAAGSLAIGNGTAGSFAGSLKLTGINNAGTYTDASASVGTAGQVLTSTATATAWVNAASIGTAWSSLTGTLSNGQVIPYADAGVSRLGAASLAIGNGTSADTTGSLSLSRVFAGAVGTIAAPQYSFLSNTNYGMFLDGNNAIQFSITGINRLAINSTGPIVRSDGVYGFASAGLFNGNDTGISRLGAASLAIGNGTAADVTGSLSYLTGVLNGATASVTIKSGATIGSVMNQAFGLAFFNGQTISFSLTGATGDVGISHTSTAGVLGIGNGTVGDITGTVSLATLITGSTSVAVAVHNGGTVAFSTGTSAVDTGLSRLGAASLAIGNGTASNTTGNLSLNRINKAGADFAGQATVTAGNTTQAVTFAANYTGTGQPVIVLTPTSDPLAAGLPVGYWVTYSGGAGAWTGWVLNIQTALAGNITFNYIVVGVA